MYLPSSFNYSALNRFFTSQGNPRIKSKEIDRILGKITRIQSSSASLTKPETQQASEKPSTSAQATSSDKSSQLTLPEASSLLKRLDQLFIHAQDNPNHYANTKKQEKIDKASKLKTALLNYQALLLDKQNHPPAVAQAAEAERFSPPEEIEQYENWMTSFKKAKKAIKRDKRRAIRRKTPKPNMGGAEASAGASSSLAKEERLKSLKPLSFSKDQSQGVNTAFPYDLNPFFDPPAQEGGAGIILGAGKNGRVISDPTDPTYVIKKFAAVVLGERISKADKIKTALEEVTLFNKYYGEDSAEVIEQNEDIYIRMIKIPGISLEQCVKDDNLPKNIGLLLMDLIIRLNECKIIHMDFHPGNILYDPNLNTLFPIDLSNEYNIYYDSSDDEKEQVNKVHSYYFNKLIQHVKDDKFDVL